MHLIALVMAIYSNAVSKVRHRSGSTSKVSTESLAICGVNVGGSQSSKGLSIMGLVC